MMRAAILAMAMLVPAAASAQVYSAYSEAVPARARSGSSVAYDGPVQYIHRLRPSRHYPPSRYGYVEVAGKGIAQGGIVRTGR